MNIVRNPRRLNRSTFLAPLLVAASLILSACGGDGKKNTSTTSNSSSSTHSLIPTPVTPIGSGTWPEIKVTADGNKKLHFQWSSGPAGTTFYKLWKNPDISKSDNTFVLIEDNITSTTGDYSAWDKVSVHIEDWINSRYRVQACSDATTCDTYTDIIIDNAMHNAVTYIKASNADANDWFGWSIALSSDGQTLAVGAPTEDSNGRGAYHGEDVTQDSNTSPNSGAVYVFSKNTAGLWQQQAYLKASNTEQPNENPFITLANDRFGYQIAISADGNSLAVSAILEDSRSQGIGCDQEDESYTLSSATSSATSSVYTTAHLPYNIGAVYVFKRSAGLWSQTAYIKPTNPIINKPIADLHFGTALSLSGDGKALAVGTDLDSTYGSGIYDLRSASSSPCVNISSSSVSSSSVSSSSTTSSSLLGGSGSGAVHLFKETDAGWIEETYIKAADAGASDHFGVSVALSNDGKTLAVGATGEDSADSTATDSTVTIKGTSVTLNNGGVYIFVQDADIWVQQAKVKPHNNGIDQLFGYSVAISGDGNTLAVGSPGDLTTGSGSEPIEAGAMGPLAKAYNLETDIFTYQAGAAYIFKREADIWTATSYLKASNPQIGYRFGQSLALSKDGTTLAVGSEEEASAITGINGDQADTSAKASGAAYIFKLNGTLWQQKSYVKAPDTTANDRFGHALQLDETGETLAVGAYREGGSTKGINGEKTDTEATKASGSLYLY